MVVLFAPQASPAEPERDPAPAADPAPGGDLAPAADAARAGEPEALSAEDEAALMAFIVQKIDEVQAKVMDKLATKMAAKNEARFDLVIDILFVLSLSGLLLLLLPLFLRRRYPGRGRELFKLSATAAVMFVVTMLLFSALLVVFKSVQAELSIATNPVVQLTDAAFDALKDNLGELGEFPDELVLPPLEQLISGAAEDVPTALLSNAAAFAHDVTVFKSLARTFSWVKDILGFLPILLSLLVVALFLMTQKDIVLTIIRMPERVISGEATAAEVNRLVRHRLVAEALTTGALLLGLAVLMVLTTLAMVVVAQPAAEALIGYVLVNLLYVTQVPEASTALVYVSVGGTLLFIVLALVSLVLGAGFLLGKWQKILRARFADGVPLGSHKRFIRLGSLGFLWILVFPFLFILAAGEVIDLVLAGIKDGDWTMALASGPLILVLGFVLFYWLLRGLRTQRYLFRYKVAPTAAGAA
ncbi:MAG: hypothetical protein CVU56_15155 [Deltaproteobacteria bacterium HGW-Deltaproteobacteria-14]|nr:MAG: hypothetical protein CVU56_15155 [Deltaproteobacteria bacterium HGW-Deltaproteobacteria-14]